MDISNFIAVFNTFNKLESIGWIEKSIEIEPDPEGWLCFVEMTHPTLPNLTCSFAGSQSDDDGEFDVFLDTDDDGDEFKLDDVPHAMVKFAMGVRLSEIQG